MSSLVHTYGDALLDESRLRASGDPPAAPPRPGLLIGLVSIGDVLKMHIAEADMEAAAREYAA
jgi:hypothetical protein